MGRACINHPYMWINTDRDIYNDTHQVTLSRGDIIEKYISYLESVELLEKDWGKGKGQGVEGLEKSPVRALLAPVYNLFNGKQAKGCNKAEQSGATREESRHLPSKEKWWLRHHEAARVQKD